MLMGVCIGKAYVEGRGMCDVFTDLDNKNYLVLVTKSGERLYRGRSSVMFRKSSPSKTSTQGAGR